MSPVADLFRSSGGLVVPERKDGQASVELEAIVLAGWTCLHRAS